jgi:hypothetical protein
MIRMLIAVALNRDLQGEVMYIRCAQCGTVDDTPTRTLSVTTIRAGRPPEHISTPPEWTCPSCGRSGPLEVGEELPNDALTRCRRAFICRYVWKVPRSLATVTCPRCYTRQPAAHVSG